MDRFARLDEVRAAQPRDVVQDAARRIPSFMFWMPRVAPSGMARPGVWTPTGGPLKKRPSASGMCDSASMWVCAKPWKKSPM